MPSTSDGLQPGVDDGVAHRPGAERARGHCRSRACRSSRRRRRWRTCRAGASGSWRRSRPAAAWRSPLLDHRTVQYDGAGRTSASRVRIAAFLQGRQKVSSNPSRWEFVGADPLSRSRHRRARPALPAPGGAMAAIERIATGFRFTEGPAWYGDGRYLLFTDIPNDALLRWDEITGAVATLRNPAGHPDGNTRDRQGRLITCELGSRTLTRTEHDGTVTVLADRVRGHAADRAERRRREVRRLDLVQRQRRRHPRQLSGRQGAAGDAVPRLSARPGDRRAHHRGRRHGAAERACASRPTRSGSTSSTRRAAPEDHACLRHGRRQGGERPAVLRRHARLRRRHPRATPRATSGAASPAARARTASRSSRRTAR